MRFIVIGASALLIALAACWSDPSHSAELIWSGDFETGDFSQYKDHFYGLEKRSAKKIVTSPVRAGKYATQLEILGRDIKSGPERAELTSLLKNKGGKISFDWDGPEYWIGFSFLFKEWDANAYTFFQLHAPNEPKGDPCDMAGNTFSIWGDNADLNDGVSRDIAVRIIEDGGVSRGNGAASNTKVVYSYPFPIDEWQDYVVNFKLSTRGKGFYKVWKNGKQIYSKSGLTNVNYRDSCGKKIAKDKRRHVGAYIGIYAPAKKGYRRIFYDEVRVAEGSDGYELVAPPESTQSASSPPATSTPNPPVISIE